MPLRSIAALLLSLLLAFPALAESPAERLAGLDILAQTDDRLAGSSYTYRGYPFQRNGCQPASIANALCAVLNDADLDSPGLLRELMHLLAPQNRPQERKIDTSRLSYLTGGDYSENYPILNSQLQAFDHSAAAVSVLNTDQLLQQVAALKGQRFLLSGKITLKSHWDWLVELTHQLLQAGYGDASLAIASLGAGTPGTSGPFRSPNDNGHYIALYLHVREFCSAGTLYLLDSYPRALADEASGKNEFYPMPYEFCKEHKQKVFTAFNSVYTVSRISPTVLQISLLPEALQEMQELHAALEADPALQERYAQLRVSQLRPLQFFGTGVFFLTSP